MWWHHFLFEIRTKGLHAHVQSEWVHTSTVKSTKYQVPVSNIVADATGSRVHTTSIHKYPPSVSCHVPRCSIPSQHISPMMRPNELPQNHIFIQHIHYIFDLFVTVHRFQKQKVFVSFNLSTLFLLRTHVKHFFFEMLKTPQKLQYSEWYLSEVSNTVWHFEEFDFFSKTRSYWWNNMTVCHMPWIGFLTHSRSARQCLMRRTSSFQNHTPANHTSRNRTLR